MKHTDKETRFTPATGRTQNDRVVDWDGAENVATSWEASALWGAVSDADDEPHRSATAMWGTAAGDAAYSGAAVEL